MSDQEQRDEPQQPDEPVEDLEVSEEQTDDVTGGAFRGRTRDKRGRER